MIAVRNLPVVGAFESTYLPEHDVDVAESSGHIHRRASDLRLLRDSGVRRLRYPIRWHRVEPEAGRFDWRDADESFAILGELGMTPIVDLVHHTSYPRWLRHGFADPEFGPAYLRYITAFAERYPDVAEYTLFNEPLATLLLCSHEGVWPPYGVGVESFVAMMVNVLPAVCAAQAICTELLPQARHVWSDTCEHHTGDGRGVHYARYANDRRFFVLDAVLGRLHRTGSDERPFVRDVVAHGGERLLELDPLRIDVLGLDYYAHNQWHFPQGPPTSPTGDPKPLADLVEEYWRRYRIPCMLTETNIRGFASDRATWLKYTAEQCHVAVRRGVELLGWCWFPVVDSCDWASLLTRHECDNDPVGVYVVRDDGERLITSVARSYAALASGAHPDELPAYRLQEPVRSWLSGYEPQMAHWRWEDPPFTEVIGAVTGEWVPGEGGFDALGGHLR